MRSITVADTAQLIRFAVMIGACALLAVAFARAEEDAPKTPTPKPALPSPLGRAGGHGSMAERPQATPVPRKDFAATLAGTGKHKTLIELIDKAGMAETFKGRGPYSLFAPVDDAFARLPKVELDALKADPAKLKELLNYHLVKGLVIARDIHKGKPQKTAQGGELAFKPGTGKAIFLVNDIEIGRIHHALNGRIIEINGVLTPKK